MAETCAWLPFLSVPGMLAFLGGVWLLFYDSQKFQTLGFTLLAAGALAIGGSIVLNAVTAKAKRAGWPIVRARCVERTLQNHNSYESNFWLWNLVCEMNFAGKNYRIIPKVRWSDAGQSESPFFTEAKAQAFITQAITLDGQCQLRVNPQNPQEAELMPRHDIAI